VSRAVLRHPTRFVGFFMLDPLAGDAVARVEQAFNDQGLTVVCLFPAMHRYSLHDSAVTAVIEAVAKFRKASSAAIFVHCGALSVGVRKKLGLPSRFDVRYGNPLDIHALAADHPDLPFIVPHFGAGLFREALMVADLCPNVYLDTSSSNHWLAYHPGLTLVDVLRQAIDTLGPDRLLFGTDSSFFPRGWQRAVYEAQVKALETASVDVKVQARIFGENFDRLFPLKARIAS
jgi:uncharacterized protein